ncbi:MAG: hypothetical protein M3Q88_01880 [Pseudomonadota bacterium]|nr:hypothetical protein [Pseudomonadota bacterium]
MRFFFIVAAVAMVAGCGTTQKPEVSPARPVPIDRAERGDLIGLDSATLIERFGRAQFQVREGDGSKLQFAGGSCVLDAYLYPATSGGGSPRVIHVDTRDREGRVVGQAACIRMIEAR